MAFEFGESMQVDPNMKGAKDWLSGDDPFGLRSGDNSGNVKKYSRGYGRNSIGFNSSQKPEDTFANSRARNTNWADQFNEDFGGRMDSEDARYGRHDSEWDEGLEGFRSQPGYDQDTQNGILQNDWLKGGVTGDEDLAGNFLTQEEQDAIKGDPSSRGNWFSPDAMEAKDREGAGWVRNQFTQMGDNARSTADWRNKLTRNAMDRGDEQIEGELNQGRDSVRGALDSSEANTRGELSRLRSGMKSNVDDYKGTSGGVVDNYSSSASSAIDPNKLSLTDDEVNDLKESAGRQVGAQYGNTRSALLERAKAAGQVNPLAIAAMEDKLNHNSAVANADAMSDAGVNALMAQKEGNSKVAQMRLGVADKTADLGMSRAGTAAGLGENAEALPGQLGANLENSMGTRRSGMENDMTGLRSSILNQRNQNRSNTEMNIGNADVGLETGLGEAGMNMESKNSDRNYNTEQYKQTFGTDIARDKDNTASNRASTIATNRQATAQGNQGTKWGQALQGSQALSGRYSTIGNANQQGRQFYTQGRGDQTKTSGDQATKWGQLRVNGVQGSESNVNQANKTAADYKSQNPSFGRRLTDAGLKAGAAYLGGL